MQIFHIINIKQKAALFSENIDLCALPEHIQNIAIKIFLLTVGLFFTLGSLTH